MPLDANRFYLIRATNGASLMVRRGNDPPKITGGGARYNVIERPRRRSTVQWMGDDPYRMDVPILIEGWPDRDIEVDVSKINKLVHSPGNLVPPTQIYIDGGLPVKGAKWVVEGIEWGSMVIWSSKGGKGHRLRQDCTLRLLQTVSPSVLRMNQAPTANLPYIVKTGDTAASIAKDHGVSTNDIKKANQPMRDVKVVANKVGSTILVPPSHMTDAHSRTGP